MMWGLFALVAVSIVAIAGFETNVSGTTGYALAALAIPAYVLAVATGVSRVEARRHFPSDVLVGAAVGALRAGIVDSLHVGGERRGEGISRRLSASGDVGIGSGPDGRPAVVLTIHF